MDENDLKTVVPRHVLVKQGISALASLAGGVFLMVMAVGVRFGIFGMILPAAALVFGIGALLSKDREDKKPGLIIATGGIMGLIIRFGIPILKPFAATFLTIGALSLFAAGIWKGIKFILGLNSRR